MHISPVAAPLENAGNMSTLGVHRLSHRRLHNASPMVRLSHAIPVEAVQASLTEARNLIIARNSTEKQKAEARVETLNTLTTNGPLYTVLGDEYVVDLKMFFVCAGTI